MVQQYLLARHLHSELDLFKKGTYRTIYLHHRTLPKANMCPSTYSLFEPLIHDVEEAFTTNSHRLQFFALITLCESIINHLLSLYNIPLFTTQETSKQRQWLNFHEKLEKCTMLLLRNPMAELSQWSLLKFLYQKVRHPLMHGEILTVTAQEVEALLQFTRYLTATYKVDRLFYKLNLSS